MKTICYLLIALFALMPPAVQAQEVKKMEGEMKGSGSSDNRRSDNDTDDFELFLLELALQLAWYPTYGLFFGFEDEPRPNDSRFSQYPYVDGINGLYQPLDWDGKRMRANALAHFQNNEDAVSGGYFQIRFFPARSIALDVNHLQFFETLDNGEKDLLGITNFNVMFNRVRHPKFHLWWGGGATMVRGDDLYGGLLFSSGFNWYFKKPLSLYADGQWGFAGDAFTRQYQARMQVHLKQYMLYCGYQGTKIGDTAVRSWALGTGVWF